MAKVSHDPSSWKAGGVLRRDFRNTKNGPEVPRSGGVPTKTKKSKLLKLYCHANPKLPHTLVWKKWLTYGPYYEKTCTNCGKTGNLKKFVAGRPPEIPPIVAGN